MPARRSRVPSSRVLAPVLTLAGLCLTAGAASLAAGGETAATQATGILSRRCISCHNGEKKSGGVDLSTRMAAEAAGATAPIDPAKNRLLRMVTTGKMPPSGKLPAEETAALRAWVSAGAPYPTTSLEAARPSDLPLWSLAPVRQPGIPHTKWDALARNPIDQFVFAKLAEKGLHPSPPASRPALLRRVTLDLTGLPPTPEEIAAFVADRAPNAYEKVVDHLLASPAYGECWGQHWLDVIRYGESNGYERNHTRPNAWPFRDYVIQSFNDDKPYNRFITEQLAGDVVGKGDPKTEVATGFLVAGVHDDVGIATEEGTRQQRFSDLDDITSTTAEAFQGLTIGCAKCHDHKFDPIPQKDYYRLQAVFAGVRHGERAVSGVGTLAGTNRRLEKFAPVTARFVRFTIQATVDATEPCLDEVELYGPDSDRNVALASSGARASASSLLQGYAIHQIPHLNDGLLGNEHSWISGERNGGWVQIELPQPARLDRLVWSRDGTSMPRYNDRLASAYRIDVSDDGTSWKSVVTHVPAVSTGIVPGMQAYIGQFTAPDPVYVLKRGDVMQRMDQVTPGAFSRFPTLPGELENTAPDTDPNRRLALAKWLTDPRNPLTARVMVNRVWHYHFGRGLVGTPSDFGHNGEKPTHPELLDWLASRFAGGVSSSKFQVSSSEPRPQGASAHPRNEGGAQLETRNSKPETAWSLKALHRLICTSYTYQQASAADEAGMKVDAGNQYLWRMPLRRMEAEAVRDAMLATSGKLNRAMGGPSYQLFKYKIINVAFYEPLDEYAPETWRRSVYRMSVRAIRDPLLATFDCPETASRTPRRENTTTALQALSLLNGPFTIQQAGFFADRVRTEAGAQPEKQVARAFLLAFGREATARERAAASELVSRVGLAALCRGLMNANEFLYY